MIGRAKVVASHRAIIGFSSELQPLTSCKSERRKELVQLRLLVVPVLLLLQLRLLLVPVLVLPSLAAAAAGWCMLAANAAAATPTAAAAAAAATFPSG
jgi:hypothetical protein